jgi:hypothetical protein
VVQHTVNAVECFSICAALANSFLENMSFTVLAFDLVTEVLGTSLQLGCCVVGCEATVGAGKTLCFNSVFGN